MKIHIFTLSCSIILLYAGCARFDHVHSSEVAVYDQIANKSNARSLLIKLHVRAMEPYILAGEDTENLTLSSLALLKKLGDAGFANQIGLLTGEERSAIRLFIRPSDLGVNNKLPSGNYPRTVRVISSAEKKNDWPCVVADKVFSTTQSTPFDDPDKWP